MATPKLPADQIAELRTHADNYLQAHREGDYSQSTVDMREGGMRYFLAYLEGTYDPATDKGHFKQ